MGNDRQPQPTRIPIPVALLLLAALPILWIVYSLALPGFFLFDDAPHLASLDQVVDWRSLVGFILSGDSFPLGRPVALASFGVQAGAWPLNPDAFLQLNIWIHLANTVFVFALATALTALRPTRYGHTHYWVGLSAALLWGASPFLANTSLMVIQRMTSLSALFVFAGLATLAWAHLVQPSRVGLRALLFAVFLMAIPLAALSKENGALLPLLGAAILYAWIPRERRWADRQGRVLYAVGIMIPAALVLLYVAYRTPGILSAGYGDGRYFTPGQRLLSQPWVLLDYVWNLLIPKAVSASPFLDQWPAPTGFLSPPIVAVALAFWSTLIVAAVWWRNKTPWLLFAVVFFLTGHLLESTIFNLELYFAHRNYIPAFGLYFGLAWAAFNVPAQYFRVAMLGLSAYILIFFLILAQATSGWNDRFLSAVTWQMENPRSERGAQFLANQYLAIGAPESARLAFDQLAELNPRLARNQILRTQFCVSDHEGFSDLLHEVKESLVTARFDNEAALELVNAAFDPVALNGYCAPRDIDALATMARALFRNPAYQRNPEARSYLTFVLALEEEEKGEISSAAELATEAFRIRPNIDIGLYAANLIVKTGNREAWDRFLIEIGDAAPQKAYAKRRWMERVEEYQASALGGGFPDPD